MAAVSGASGESVALGFEGVDTVANPLAGLDAGFFFFLLGAMMPKTAFGVYLKLDTAQSTTIDPSEK